MVLNKYYYMIKIIAAVFLLNFTLHAATPATRGVDYGNIGIWYNDTNPTDVQLVERQSAVNEDTLDGVNKLKVSVRMGETDRAYFSGLFSRRSGGLALIEVLAEDNFQGFDISAMNDLMKCMSNDHGRDYAGEQRAAVSLFRAVNKYLEYCTEHLCVDGRRESIEWISKLAVIMLKDDIQVSHKLALALEHINSLGRKPKGLDIIPVLKSRGATLTGGARVALQMILSKLKDVIRDAVAHSEMIALFDIFKLRSNKTPTRLVTSLDMCYQCEKACVTVLPLIPASTGIEMPSEVIQYKILVGSYKPYANDGMEPKNTRARLDGTMRDLVKVALTPGDDASPLPDIVISEPEELTSKAK